MAAAQRDAKLEYHSLGYRADYAARLTLVDLGPLWFQDARDGAHVVRGEIQPGRTAILIPNGGVAEGLKVNGWGEWQDSGILLRAGAELLAVTPTPQAWSALVVSEDQFGGLFDRPGLPRQGAFTALPGLMAQAPGLAGFARSLGLVAWTDPGRLASGSVADALADELLFYVSQACGEIADGWRATLQLGRRTRLVSQAEDYLGSKLRQPVYTGDVAEALGVSERTLSEAFIAIYGMSLQRYLLLRRLNQVNRVLSEPQAAPPLVKTAALDFGFWHLGRFAHAYRQVFGETPAQTAGRRGRGRYVPVARAARAGRASLTEHDGQCRTAALAIVQPM